MIASYGKQHHTETIVNAVWYADGGSADYNKWEETLSREELSSSALRDNSAGQHSQDWGLWDSSTKKSSRDALEILQESTSQQP